MERLARHSFYLALFLGTLLTITGLFLYPELTVFTVVVTVLAIMAGLSLLAWAFVSLVKLSQSPTPPQQRNVPESMEMN